MLDKSNLSTPIINNSTLKPYEIAKFDSLANEWWDPNGKMKSALAFNQARLHYIKKCIADFFDRDVEAMSPLSGLTLLDVGCGGGLLSEPLALAGADVTGIDASAASVEVAKRHAKMSQANVNYQHALSSTLVERRETFDIVINAEVVEHVHDQKRLISECCQLLNTDGLLILATLNKTWKSNVIAIIGAEYIMRYLPIGTHDWRYFVPPENLQQWTSESHLELYRQTGMAMNPLSGKWRLTQDMSVNYVQSYMRAKQ